MIKIELAARLEGVDPFGENVLLDEGIMEGSAALALEQLIHPLYKVLTRCCQLCLLDAGCYQHTGLARVSGSRQ